MKRIASNLMQMTDVEGITTYRAHHAVDIFFSFPILCVPENIALVLLCGVIVVAEAVCFYFHGCKRTHTRTSVMGTVAGNISGIV